jgi:hydrogenase maturation factor
MSLRAGKLPQAVLAELLASIDVRDARVLVGPGIGRDAAIIDLGEGRALVATSDPVTFATEHIGWYAVHVNANDVACIGARPAWFLATALLPEGAPDDLPARIFQELTDACAALDITLVGGHTEVCLGLDRPIIAGTMLGDAATADLVSGRTAQPGDAVLFTQAAGIEGTALLAIEAKAELRRNGVPDEVISRAAALLSDPGISVVRAARTICDIAQPAILHDPTEGGIATALHEMSHAAGLTLRIDPGSVPLLEETRAICAATGIDPLGLLASGALLAIVPAPAAAQVIASLRNVMIPCRSIGQVESGPPRVIMGAEQRSWPEFDRDELARYLSTRDASGGQRADTSEG